MPGHAPLPATARETWPDTERAERQEERFAERYGIALDRDHERFSLLLDPLTWGQPRAAAAPGGAAPES
ncbi:hypothetical protein ACFVIM_16670 [Streptomyces sp. NPDC057638]|uniref:hypothetical protein n=1 Tax=Streptomyces sp. NPDC057638 TaxID=3346190 RepID=UPI0036CE3C16